MARHAIEARPMDVIVAARRSRLSGEAQTAIDSQDQDGVQWAKNRRFNVVHVAADTISGTVSPFQRKDLGLWLTEPEKMARYQGIVFVKIDRMVRARDWELRQWAEDHGKVLFIVSPELRWPPLPNPDGSPDTITPQMWDMLVNQAIAEWQNTSARYKRMQRQLRENDRLVGRPNYGYKAVKVGDHKTLVQDKIMGPLIRQAALEYIKGEKSLLDLCEWLAENGAYAIRYGKPIEFRPTTLSQVFRNPALYGRRRGGLKTMDARKDKKAAKERTDLKIANPILTRDEWDALQEALDRRAGRKGIASRETAMLTSAIVCAKCDGPMYRHYAHARQRGQSYYRCRGSETSPSKCGNCAPLDQVEAYVDQWFTVGPFSEKEVTRIVVIRGHANEEAIAEIDEEIDGLDRSNPKEYLTKVTELLAVRERLADPANVVPDQVTEEELGITVAEYWRSLASHRERRAYILQTGIKVHAAKHETGLECWIDGSEPHKLISSLTHT